MEVEFVSREQFEGLGFPPYRLFCLAYPAFVYPYCRETEGGWYVYKSREDFLAHLNEHLTELGKHVKLEVR